MNAQRVEVLHVADSDAVVKTVANHFILHFFPAFERFLYKHLWRERERFFYECGQLGVVVAETAAEAAEGVCRTNDDGVAQFVCHAQGVGDALHGIALNGVYAYLVETFHKELAVFGIHNRADRGAEYTHAIALEYARCLELYAAV